MDLTHRDLELELGARREVPRGMFVPAKLARFLSTTSDGTLVMHGHVLLFTWHDVANRRHAVTCKLADGRFVFTGSLTGEHSLDAGALITDAARLHAHWSGYLAAAQAAADRDADALPHTRDVQ